MKTAFFFSCANSGRLSEKDSKSSSGYARLEYFLDAFAEGSRR